MTTLLLNKLYFLILPDTPKYLFLGKYLGKGKFVKNKFLYEANMHNHDKNDQENEWVYSFSAYNGQLVAHDDIEHVITVDQYKDMYEKDNPGSIVTFTDTSYSITTQAHQAKSGGKRRKSMCKNKRSRSTRQKIQKHYYR
jgi:hypothetical protein